MYLVEDKKKMVCFNKILYMLLRENIYIFENVK